MLNLNSVGIEKPPSNLKIQGHKGTMLNLNSVNRHCRNHTHSKLNVHWKTTLNLNSMGTAYSSYEKVDGTVPQSKHQNTGHPVYPAPKKVPVPLATQLICAQTTTQKLPSPVVTTITRKHHGTTNNADLGTFSNNTKMPITGSSGKRITKHEIVYATTTK